LKISRAWIVSTAKRNVQSYMVSDRAERPPKPMARMNSGDHCTTCNVETTPMSVGRVSLSPAVIASRAILHGRRLGTWHLTPKWQPSSTGRKLGVTSANTNHSPLLEILLIPRLLQQHPLQPAGRWDIYALTCQADRCRCDTFGECMR